ncbi:hypothetical protein EE612_057071, partial [Oryza sativa]
CLLPGQDCRSEPNQAVCSEFRIT